MVDNGRERTSAASRLTWYVRRLNSMERRELVWRLGKALQSVFPTRPMAVVALAPDFENWSVALEGFRAATDRPVILDAQRAEGIAAESPELVNELVEAADRIMQGSFTFFGYPRVNFQLPIDWNYDPLANVRWPDLPSHRIDHRVAAGDVKWIWELNRLQHLPILAEAWLFTGDNRYSRMVFEHLDSWIAQNDTDRGIAWRGAFELGIRSISIAIALQGVRDAPELTVDRYARYVRLLGTFAARCWRNRSLHSSANNHLVGEMAGLAVISMLFPELKQSQRWERLALATLSDEANKQILPDGGGAEQAVGYQVFTIELLQLVALLQVARDGTHPRAITDAIERSCAYLRAVIGKNDPAPRYGDDDEGFALRLGPQPVRTVRDHLGSASAFSWGSTPAGEEVDSLEAQWFRALASAFPSELQSNNLCSDVEVPGAFYARDSGLVVLRRGRQRITMDVGSLGYLSIAAHGHADALAVTLSVDNHDVISDPGTGSYYGHPQWRAAMRSTRSHATISVDDEDQSINVGPFMWSKHARTKVRKVDLRGGVIDAEHDGYLRRFGVLHRRWLVAPPERSLILIVDMVSGRDAHQIRSTWPLHPDIEIEKTADGHNLLRGGTIVMKVLSAGTVPLRGDNVRGDETANTGWWSDRLESRRPAWWLGFVGKAEPPVVIATLFAPREEIEVQGLRVQLNEGLIAVRWYENRVPSGTNISTHGAAMVDVNDVSLGTV